MLILVFYVPLTAKEEVKQSCFSAGAGRLGVYDECCFETYGYGQFKPLQGSKPHIGSHDCVERVEEARIEMIVQQAYISDVIKALKASHPYEEVAFHVYQSLDLEEDYE